MAADFSHRPASSCRCLPRGPLFILAGALCFSTTGFAQALAPEGATPYVIGGIRMLGGGLALLLWCALRGLLPRRGGWPPDLVLKRVIPAALALVGFQICFFRGVQEAGVAVGTVAAIGFSPVVVAVLGFLLLGEKPAKIWYLSTVLAVSGLVLLNWRNGGSGGDVSALVLPLAAGFCYACYYVFSKPLGQKHPPETVMMVLCLVSGICLLPVFFVHPTAWMLSLPGALVALHLGVTTTALAFSLTLAGLRDTPAAAAATLGLGEPLGAACLGIFFLHESVGVPALAGMALLLCGVVLLTVFSGGRKKETPIKAFPASRFAVSAPSKRIDVPCPKRQKSLRVWS